MHTHPGTGDRCSGFRRRRFRRGSSACSLLVGLVAILAVTFAMPALESAAQDVEDLTSRIGENTEEAAVEALEIHTGKASPLGLHPGVVAITMSGGRRRYQGFRDVSSWKGYETSGYAVVNGYLGYGLVGGLGLGRVIGSADLDGQIPGQMPVPFTAVLEYGTTSVFPGLGWRWAPGSGLWAGAGLQRGRDRVEPLPVVLRPARRPQQSDVTQRAVAVGASVRLFSVGAAESGRRMTLTLRSIALSSRFESAGNNGLLQKRTQDGHRLGLALESAGTFDLASGVLMPQVQVGVNQRDTGKENFTYLKLAGALAYTLPRWDLTVSVNVNTMLAHEKKDRNLYGGILLHFSPASLFRKLSGDGAD